MGQDPGPQAPVVIWSRSLVPRRVDQHPLLPPDGLNAELYYVVHCMMSSDNGSSSLVYNVHTHQPGPDIIS